MWLIFLTWSVWVSGVSGKGRGFLASGPRSLPGGSRPQGLRQVANQRRLAPGTPAPEQLSPKDDSGFDHDS